VFPKQRETYTLGFAWCCPRHFSSYYSIVHVDVTVTRLIRAKSRGIRFARTVFQTFHVRFVHTGIDNIPYSIAVKNFQDYTIAPRQISRKPNEIYSGQTCSFQIYYCYVFIERANYVNIVFLGNYCCV